jgi:PAS domain S-box-containing protein
VTVTPVCFAKTSIDPKNIEAFAEVIALPAFVISVGADKELRFQLLNHAHVATVGIPSDSLKGKTPHEALPERIADTVLMNYQTCVDTKAHHIYEEVLNLNGSETWWRTSLSPVFGDDEEVTAILGIATDITAEKAKELEAVRAYSDLKEVNQEISLFTSMTAHDVRGPLRRIRSLIEFVLEDFKDLGDNKTTMLNQAVEIGKNADYYVENTLSYARALGTEPTKPETFDLESSLHDLLALIDPNRELSIELNAPKQISCESMALQVIIRNLLENSCRHNAKHIAITAKQSTDAIGFLKFTIADDGEGFEGGENEFQSFIQKRQSRAENRGFGLSAISHLVDTRNGTVKLEEPKFETGATISFTFPAKLVPSCQTSAKQSLDLLRKSA